jgi:hypothetical protein
MAQNRLVAIKKDLPKFGEPRAVKELKTKANEMGVNWADVCWKAKLDRSIFVRWGQREPKSFQIYWAMHDAIEQLANEKTDTANEPDAPAGTSEPITEATVEGKPSTDDKTDELPWEL